MVRALRLEIMLSRANSSSQQIGGISPKCRSAIRAIERSRSLSTTSRRSSHLADAITHHRRRCANWYPEGSLGIDESTNGSAMDKAAPGLKMTAGSWSR